MRKLCRAQIIVGILFILVVGPQSSAAAEELCPGVDREGYVTRLDGANAVIDGTVEDLDDLRALIEEQNEAFAAVLVERGLGDVTGPLFHALAAGQVVETTFVKGDRLEWMTTRKKGKVTSFGPVCMATDEVYEAFELEIKEEGATHDKIHHFLVPKVCGNLALVATKTVAKPLPPIPPPVVVLAVDRNCATGKISVDSSGSSEGVIITMKTQDGVEKVVAPGEFDDLHRYTTPLTFTAVAENTSREGVARRAEKTRSVDACPAPPPTCYLDVSADDVWTREDFTVNADGHWAEDGLALRILDGDGNEIERLVPAPSLPYSTSIRTPGFYRVQGGATNEIGETAGCEAKVYVRPRWRVRPKAVNISPTDRKNTVLLAGVDERTLGFDTAQGAQVDLEYFMTRRLGLEASVAGGSVDSHMQRVLLGQQEMATDSNSLMIFSGALNWHLTLQPGVDFYIGPVVAMADVGNSSYRLFGDTVTFDGGSNVGFGGQMGIDVPFGKATAWGLHLGLRFLDVDVDDDQEIGSVRLDPFLAGLGLSYGF